MVERTNVLALWKCWSNISFWLDSAILLSAVCRATAERRTAPRHGATTGPSPGVLSQTGKTHPLQRGIKHYQHRNTTFLIHGLFLIININKCITRYKFPTIRLRLWAKKKHGQEATLHLKVYYCFNHKIHRISEIFWKLSWLIVNIVKSKLKRNFNIVSLKQ